MTTSPLTAVKEDYFTALASAGIIRCHGVHDRQVKAHGEAQQDEACMTLAKKLWTLRWSLLKKPGNLSVEEKQAITELESEDEGFVHSFRNIIRQLVNIFDHTHSQAQAKLRL